MGRTDYKGGMEGGEATRGRAMIDTLCGKMSHKVQYISVACTWWLVTGKIHVFFQFAVGRMFLSQWEVSGRLKYEVVGRYYLDPCDVFVLLVEKILHHLGCIKPRK